MFKLIAIDGLEHIKIVIVPPFQNPLADGSGPMENLSLLIDGVRESPTTL